MFAIVDIETCGGKFDFQRGRIIEICILVHDGISVIDKFSTLLNPGCHISSFYTKLSGISNEMVKDAPYFHQVAKEIINFTEGKLFVAHNVGFDYNFIKEEFASLGYKFKRDKLCTVKLSRKLLPGKKSYSLGNLCESIGITIENRHRAEGDAVATAKLLDILLQIKTQSKQYKTASVDQLMTTRLDNIKKYILDKLPDSCGVYYFTDKDHQILYIGKSISMYSRAIQHFNSDVKKTKEMLHLMYNVDYVETGSELISLLLESEEIKKHKPRFNTARKKDVFTHCIDSYYRDDILHFKILPTEESTSPLVAFNTYASARECLEAMMEQYSLCMKYCGLISEDSKSCFNHQIKKCFGICANQESAEDYNRRAIKVVEHFSYSHPNFMIVERGRNDNERAFVLIQDNKYVGYGYIDHDSSIIDINEARGYLHNTINYPDSDTIVRGWLKQAKNFKVVKF